MPAEARTQKVPVAVRKRVLLMGTSVEVVSHLQRILRRSRVFQLHVITHSAALVATLADETFDYVLVDLTLGDETIWDDLLYLRQKLAEVPVVGLLNQPHPVLESRARQEGVLTFLTPPFTAQAIRKTLTIATDRLSDHVAFHRSLAYIEASSQIHVSLNLKEVIEAVIRGLTRLTPCQKIRILLSEIDPEKPALGFEATFSELGRPTVRPLDRDEASIELATASLQKETLYQENILTVPIRCDDDQVGSMSLRHPRSLRLKDHELQLIENLARHLAIGVRNAQRYDAMHHSHNQIFLINEVGRQVASCLEFDTILTDIVDHVRRYFNYDIVALYLPILAGPHGQNHYLASRIGNDVVIRTSVLDGDLGLIHYVMNTQQTVICHDLHRQTNWKGYHTGSRSKLVSPIWMEGNIAGTLEFESLDPHAFDSTDRRVAEDIAMQISVAVRNTRLYHDAQVAREYLQTVLDVAVDTAIISTDTQGHIITFSRGAEILFGRNTEEMVGNQVDPLFDESSAKATIEELFRTQSDEPWESDVRLVRQNGETFFAYVTVRPLRARQSPGYLFLLLDITQRLNLQERLHRLSITDELTGLYNKRYFTTLLPREISRSERQRSPLVLCYFDLDGFKKFNDSKGHVQGDILLKWIGGLVQQAIRRNVDLPFRYGGDEFVLILPGTRAKDAAQVGERIRAAVERQYHGEVTVSFGVAEFCGETADELTTKADHIMYQAKHAGGNQVCVAED